MPKGTRTRRQIVDRAYVTCIPVATIALSRCWADIAEVPLTRGQLNAVRAAFKAGITPSRIARQFGTSQANVRKALASDEPRR